MKKPPRGIWYEPDRKRWRVRIYVRSRVVYLRYYDTLEEALKGYEEARKRQKEIREALKSTDTMDQILKGVL